MPSITMKWFIYVLKLKNDKHYVGSTNNLERRLQQHIAGKVISTKHLRPVELIWYKTFPTSTEARKMEQQIKKRKDKKMTKAFMDS